MSQHNLTNDEKNQLVQAVGGAKVARSLITGTKCIIDRIPLYAEAVVGGVAYRAKNDLVDRLKNKGYCIDPDAESILLSRAYKVSRTRLDLKLSLLSAHGIGLNNGGILSLITAVAEIRGLIPCPQDTAAAVMTQLSKPWSTRGSIVVVSEPVLHNMMPYLFQIKEQQLSVVSGIPEHHFGPFQHFLFRRL